MSTNAETIAAVKNAQAMAKAWTAPSTATTGLQTYSLETGAKILFPVITPLLKRIPRVGGGAGIQANWRGVTGINTSGLSGGVGQGNRGGSITTTTKEYNAVFRTLGFDDSVTYEADLAANGFEDLKALAVMNQWKALMMYEEKTILGGNGSLSLGTTPTPTVVGSATGGALNGTISVICVALTAEGVQFAGGFGSLSGISASVTRTNADGSTDSHGGGSAQKSAAATGNCGSGSVGSFTATVTAVNGAVGYAWYWGAAGSEVLGAVTSINSISVTAAAAGTQTAASLPSSDNSVNSLVYDGLLTQIMTSGSGSYVHRMPTGTAGTGTPLTSDGAGCIVEIDAALRSTWDLYRLSPTDIYVSSQEQKNITAKILAANANSAQRFVFNSEQGMLGGGAMTRSYYNPYSMDGAVEIPIRLHPNLPAGTILFYCDNLPYPLSNVSNVLQIKARRDYYGIDYPIRSRKYEYGVYTDSVLQNYFPPAFGVITNIANG